jgi:hypothetical protein
VVEGEYAFNASADGHGQWPAPRYVTISDTTALTLTLAPLSNSVAAGDFEGSDVWDAWTQLNGDVVISTEAFDGYAVAQLGSGTGWPVTCAQNGGQGELWTLKQTVTVPSLMAPFLSFLRATSTPQTSFDYAWLEVVLLADGHGENCGKPPAGPFLRWTCQPGVVRRWTCSFRPSTAPSTLSSSPWIV